MSLVQKVKKTISAKQTNEIIQGRYWVVNLDTGEMTDIEVCEKALFRFLSIRQDFMKLFCDKDLCERVDSELTLADRGFLFHIVRGGLNYENQIDIEGIAEKHLYNPSRMSLLRTSLMGKWLVKKKGRNYYLSPLIAIKSKEISQDLINLFEDTFERYGVKADKRAPTEE